MLHAAVVALVLLGVVFAQQDLKKPSAGVIKFRFAAPNVPLLLVDARVNGQGPYTFVVDTGARTCLVDPELASAVGIAVLSSEERLGAGGPVHVGIGSASIAVESKELSNVEVGISDELGRISKAAGAEIRGAIGFNFLHHYRVTLNFARRELSLSNDDRVSEDSGTTFALAGKKPLITVPVHVNGKGPFTFVVDTGASATVVSEGLAVRLSIPLLDVPGRAVGAGSSDIKMHVATLDALAIGEAVVPKLPVGVVTFLGAISDQVGRQIDGIVGFNYLQAFDCVIDYPNQKIILERREVSIRQNTHPTTD